MSSYEDYATVAGAYDGTRSAVGIEVIIGCLGSSAVPLSQQSLLDAGCGTGNYSLAMIDRVRRITAVDMNADMLERAKSKFTGERASVIEFHQGAIQDLPVESSTFDGVMINQVLHHIEDDSGSGYPNTRRVLEEFARVLKPGGELVINICSNQQIDSAFWYGSLMSEEVSRMRDRHIPLPKLKRLLEKSGFEHRGRIVPLDALLQGGAYLDPRGPLDAEWRKGDSLWSTLSPRRLDEVCDRIRRLDGAGRLDAFVREHDALRRDIGQMTFVHARRL